MTFSITLLGELQVRRDDRVVALPASRKTRSLLAFLAMTARPQRRDRLCEMFWEVPDDPRGALRWSLSKLRGVVNSEGVERLQADRERVTLVLDNHDTDLSRLRRDCDAAPDSLETLMTCLAATGEPLLDGCDLPNQESFQAWLRAERGAIEHWRGEIGRRIAGHGDATPHQALAGALAWVNADPLSGEAAASAIALHEALGEKDQAAAIRRQAKESGVELTAPTPRPPSGRGGTARSAAMAPGPDMLPRPAERQTIRFCRMAEDVTLAYATIGEGPPVIKAANWLSHLELDWDAPIWSPLFRHLAREHCLVRYDERGCGLSDWDVADISFESFVNDLEVVVEASGLERFALLGISQGASVSIEYAVRHPERVSHLVLFGGYAAGWRVGASPEMIVEREAVMTLTKTGWGQDNPAYRHIFSTTFMPDATPEELTWFDEFQRATTSPDNAVRFLSAFGDIDVRHRLKDLKVPTLILHSMGDQRIPVSVGRSLAAEIPGAQFVGLDSRNHLLLGREPASRDFLDAVHAFLTGSPGQGASPSVP